MPERSRILSLVKRLACPMCGQPIFGRDAELFRGVLRCENKRCRQHWWATALSPGDVRLQLVQQFEDFDLVVGLMQTWQLPKTLAEPMFWQIPLLGNESHHHQQLGSVGLLRQLIRRLTAAPQPSPTRST